MKTTATINSEVIERVDKKQSELLFSTRSQMVEVLLRKALDYLDYYGYEKFIKIPSSGKEEI